MKIKNGARAVYIIGSIFVVIYLPFYIWPAIRPSEILYILYGTPKASHHHLLWDHRPIATSTYIPGNQSLLDATGEAIVLNSLPKTNSLNSD